MKERKQVEHVHICALSFDEISTYWLHWIAVRGDRHAQGERIADRARKRDQVFAGEEVSPLHNQALS